MPATRRLVLLALVLTIGLAAACHPVREGPTPPTATPTATGTTTPAPATPATPDTSGSGGSLQGRNASLTLPGARYRSTGAAIGNEMYLLGGLDAAGHPSADVYGIQPGASKVTLAGHLSTPTAGGAAVVSGSRILVFGGTGTGPLNTVALFDPATGSTTEAGLLPKPRSDAAATQIGNEIIVLGGFDGTAAVPDILATADGTSFHAVGKLSIPVRAPAVAVVGTTVYIAGGVVSGGDYSGTNSSAMQSYNITTGLSKVAGTLPTPLAHARATVVGDQIYVLGGWTPGGASAAIQRFDTRTGAVTPAGRLPGPVAAAAAATIGGTTYLAGGIAAKPLTDISAVTPTR